MSDQKQYPPPSAAVAQAMVWGFCVLLSLGAVIYVATHCGRHDGDDLDPVIPVVDDVISAAASIAIQQTEDAAEQAARQASRRRDRKDFLRRTLPEQLHGPFDEIDTILHATPAKKYAKTFGSLASGFKEGAGQVDHSDVAEYGDSLARNFSKAAQAARRNETEEDLHFELQESNHAAKERLIDAIIADRRSDAGQDMEFMGYLIDQEKRQFLKQTSTPLPMMSFDAPAEMDPRGWHRIENQGSMGSCQGHALSSVCELAARIAFRDAVSRGDRVKIKSLGHMFERALALRRDDDVQFSPLFAYYASQKRDGLLGSDTGSTMAGGLSAAKEDGSCPLDVMPYPNPVRYTGQFAKGAFEAAANFHIRRHSVCANYGDVFAFLSSGQGGVEIGIRWPQSWMRSNGVIERYQPDGGGGGHAICFLGYSKRKDENGRNYLWLANSWSPEWGNRGWAEVAPAAVDQMSRHPDTVMIGLSDMDAKHIRPRDVSWIGKGSVF